MAAHATGNVEADRSKGWHVTKLSFRTCHDRWNMGGGSYVLIYLGGTFFVVHGSIQRN